MLKITQKQIAMPKAQVWADKEIIAGA